MKKKFKYEMVGVYSKLRTMHSHLKDILGSPDYDTLDGEIKNSIEAVHSVLYMAEYIVVKETEQDIDIRMLKY